MYFKHIKLIYGLFIDAYFQISHFYDIVFLGLEMILEGANLLMRDIAFVPKIQSIFQCESLLFLLHVYFRGIRSVNQNPTIVS